MRIGSEILEGYSVPMGNEGLGCWLILEWILKGFGLRFWIVL